MRRSTIRPGAKLISVKAAAEEYGLPAALLYDLIKRGELPAVQPPNIRRIYIVRAGLEQKLASCRPRGHSECCRQQPDACSVPRL